MSIHYSLASNLLLCTYAHYGISGVDKGGEAGASQLPPPILQTRHKHMFKLHYIVDLPNWSVDSQENN